MRRTAYILFCVTGMALLLSACRNSPPRVELLEVKVLEDYPSGSASEFFNGRFMLMGDDAASLLIADSAWQHIGRVQLFPAGNERIPKDVKADIEAATWFKDKNESGLLLLGSGSLPPHRSSGFIVQPDAGTSRKFTLDTLYRRLEEAGVAQLNIEGLAQLPGWFVIACRGNMSFRKNFLVFLKNRFWDEQSTTEFHIAYLGGNKPGQIFSGVSGLDYSYRTDRLFLTASTEHTASTTSDGAIGKSYLWIINSMNRAVQFEAINPFDEIDLQEEDERFRGVKVESVAVISEGTKSSELVLTADNDDGKTTLYRILLRHKPTDKQNQ